MARGEWLQNATLALENAIALSGDVRNLTLSTPDKTMAGRS